MLDPLCSSCSAKMPYAVMMRRGSLEWTYYREKVTGKDTAYQVMKEAKKDHPADTEWRVFPKNVADAICYGMRLGKDISAGKTREEKRRGKKRPLMYLPENM